MTNAIEFPVDGDVPVDWSAKPLPQRRQYFLDQIDQYESWEARLLDAEYRVIGSTGYVSGWERLTRKPKTGVLEYPRWRFTTTWVRSGGKWLMVAAHHPGHNPRSGSHGSRRRRTAFAPHGPGNAPLGQCAPRGCQAPARPHRGK